MTMYSNLDLITIFIGIECISLLIYSVIVSQMGVALSFEAALRYVLQGFVGTILFMVSLTYIAIVSGNFSLTNLDGGLTIPTVLLVISLIIKLGVAPAHFVVAEVYAGSAFVAVVFLSFITRVAFIIPLLGLLSIPVVRFELAILGVLSLLVAPWSALLSVDVSRFMAHSGAAQMGYILIILSVPSHFASALGVLWFTTYLITLAGL